MWPKRVCGVLHHVVKPRHGNIQYNPISLNISIHIIWDPHWRIDPLFLGGSMLLFFMEFLDLDPGRCSWEILGAHSYRLCMGVGCIKLYPSCLLTREPKKSSSYWDKSRAGTHWTMPSWAPRKLHFKAPHVCAWNVDLGRGYHLDFRGR